MSPHIGTTSDRSAQDIAIGIIEGNKWDKHYKWIYIQAAEPKIMAVHTQNTAWVISESYLKGLLIPISSFKSPERTYLGGFLRRVALARFSCFKRLWPRRESGGYICLKALLASSGVGRAAPVWNLRCFLVYAAHAKYTSRPPGMRTAAAKTTACIRGFVIGLHPYFLILSITSSAWPANVSHNTCRAPATLITHSSATLDRPSMMRASCIVSIIQ